jgi:hypothetical protein
MPLLAHLTGHDAGLVMAMLVAAAVLAVVGARWLERSRR